MELLSVQQTGCWVHVAPVRSHAYGRNRVAAEPEETVDVMGRAIPSSELK